MCKCTIPAADLQIKDPSHKIAELRRMKNRLKDELEALLKANAFDVQQAETAAAPAAEKPAEAKPTAAAQPAEMPSLPEAADAGPQDA